MKNLETNKILASILIAGLIALSVGKIAHFLYQPNQELEKRGFQVEVATTETQTAEPKKEAPIDIVALMAAADATKGEVTFKKCSSCHMNSADGKHKIGPNLHGIVNAAKALHADFAYSSALKAKGGNWDHESLFAFLKQPQKYVPGTKMTFPGLPNPADIANVIKYLESN